MKIQVTKEKEHAKAGLTHRLVRKVTTYWRKRDKRRISKGEILVLDGSTVLDVVKIFHMVGSEAKLFRL